MQMARQIHAEQYERILELEELVKACADQGELADFALVLHEMEQQYDDLRKQARKVREAAEKLCCLLWLKNSDDGGPVRTEHVTATPRILQAVNIPKKETKEYAELMESLNVPPEVWQNDLVRVHWPGFVEHFTKLLEDGKQMPKGVNPNKRYQTFGLVLRKKPSKEEDPF